MDANRESETEITGEKGAKSGYTPVTPITPPPQGEPLLAPHALESAPVRETGYVGDTPLGPPPQGEPLLAQQASASNSQHQPQPPSTAIPQPQQVQSIDSGTDA